MVDLPKIPRRIVTTEAPRSRVSAEAAGAPMAMLGKALGDFGEGVEDVGIKLAEEEGRRAVTTGPDGMPKFEPLPAFTGRASAMYNRVGQAKWAVDMQNATEDAIMRARLEHRGDPEKFQQWSAGYIEQLVANEPDDKLKDIIRLQTTNQAQQAYRGLAVEKQNADIENTKLTLISRSQVLENRMAALARTGGVETPEYKSALADHLQIEQELTKNPLYRYPPEVAANARLRMQSEHIVEAAIGQMDGVFSKKGKDEARRFLEGVAWNPELNLTDEQRTRLVSRGLSRLEGLTSEGAAVLAGFRSEVEQTTQNWKKGIEINATSFESLIARARSLGDAKSEYQLRAAYFENKTLRDWRALPDNQKAAFVRDLNTSLNLSPSQRGIKGKIEAEAVAQGVDPAVAIMVAYRESQLNPGAVSKTGKHFGLFQLSPEQRAQYGVADNADEDAQVKGGIASLKARITDMTNRLGRAPNGAEIYLAHFQGAQGAETLLKAAPDAPLKATLDTIAPAWRSAKGETWGDAVLAANSWMKDYPNVGGFLQRINQMAGEATTRTDANIALNPYIEGARANVAGVITQEMSQGVSQMVTNFIDATKKRNAVNQDELETLVDWIQITGKFDEGKKLAEHLVAYENGRLIAALPKPQRDAFLAGLQKKAEVSGLTRAEALAQQAIESQVKLGTENLAANPHAEAPRQGIVTAVPPFLDVANPDAVAAALPQRVATARAIQNHNQQNGPVSALDTSEIERLGPVLVQGDPQTAAAILGALQRGVNGEMFAQTISQPNFKTALEGMIRTGDATRMGAAFSALDLAYRNNPQQFEASFGADIYKKMQSWQSYLSYKTPDQIADIFRKRDDPATAKVRAEIVTQMRAEANKISDADVFNETALFGFRLGASKAVVNQVQAALFRSEFADLYSELRADGVDHPNALKRAVEWQGRVWGTSVTNDNRFMRRPPEQWAPQVGGSHAWLKAEVETEIERVLGPQFTSAGQAAKVLAAGPAGAVNPLLGAVQAVPNWNYSLVADSQTEGEISRFNQWRAQNPGKTPPADLWPSYQLYVADKDNRGINLWARGPNMATEAMPVSAPVAPQPTLHARFRWSDTAELQYKKRLEDFSPFARQYGKLEDIGIGAMTAGALR